MHPIPNGWEEDLERWLRRAGELHLQHATRVRAVINLIVGYNAELGFRLGSYIASCDPKTFLDSCFVLEARPASKTKIKIPDLLVPIASMKSDGVGEGEILILFTVYDATWFHKADIDVRILGELWHVKKGGLGPKGKRNSNARMGASQTTQYNTSVLGRLLAQIDPSMTNSISLSKLHGFSSDICSQFGSVEACWQGLQQEMIQREFSRAVGVIFYRNDKQDLKFLRRQHVTLSGATQGRYRIQIPHNRSVKKMKKLVSGCLVYRLVENAVEVLLVTEDGQTWGLPKGGIEPGEDKRAAAARETLEETGIDVQILGYAGDVGRMSVYHAVPLDSNKAPIPQAGEILDARYFRIDSLPGIDERQLPILEDVLPRLQSDHT